MKKMKKLRYKLISVVLALLSLVLIAVAAITHHQSVAIIRSQSFALNNKLVEAGVEKLETSFGQLNSLFQAIYLNADFKELLRRQGTKTDSPTSFTDAALAKSVFLSALSSRQDLYSIIFIDPDSRLFYATRDEAASYEDYETCNLPQCYLDEIQAGDTWTRGMHMLPTVRHPQVGRFNHESPYVYTVARKIVNTERQFAPAGIMFITVDLSDMERLADLIHPDNSSITYITSRDGEIIFDSSHEQIGGVLPENVVSKLAGTTLRDVTLDDGKSYVMVSAQATESEWYVVTLIPEDVYTADALHVSTAILLTSVVALLIVAFFTYIASLAISRPIEELAGVMANAGLENLHERVNIRGTDEIAQLGASFNQLMSELERSIHNEYVMNLQQKEAKIQALQAQMNPHFLYNVLQSISSMALLYSAPQIETMATALGNVLRYSIKADGVYASVREELEHVNNYLAIQKIRFQDRVNYFVDVPECVMDLLLPRISLQPMVENAIVHGLEPQQASGTIAIRAWIEGGRLVIEVTDDGYGIPPEDLLLLQKALAGNMGKRQIAGIGLSNLNTRLKLLYGEFGMLKIDSEYGVGTVVQIEVPVQRR